MNTKYITAQNEYTTSDIWLVAALMTFGISYEGIEANNLSRIKFIFKDTDLLQKAILGYTTNGLQVPAATYAGNIRLLKGIINGFKYPKGTSGSRQNYRQEIY